MSEPRTAAGRALLATYPNAKMRPSVEEILAIEAEAAPGLREAALDRVLADLREEVAKARAKHAPMHSPHEGWAVILEELTPELWEHVCGDTGRSPEARHEALQVAAMGVRYILDLIDEPALPAEPAGLLPAADPDDFVREGYEPWADDFGNQAALSALSYAEGYEKGKAEMDALDKARAALVADLSPKP